MITARVCRESDEKSVETRWWLMESVTVGVRDPSSSYHILQLTMAGRIRFSFSFLMLFSVWKMPFQRGFRCRQEYDGWSESNGNAGGNQKDIENGRGIYSQEPDFFNRVVIPDVYWGGLDASPFNSSVTKKEAELLVKVREIFSHSLVGSSSFNG